jgi:hypothetical protein
LIREKKDSAKQLKQAAFMELSSPSQISLSSLNKRSKNASKTKPKVDAVSGEKGWNSLTSKGMNTHNFHLKHKVGLVISSHLFSHNFFFWSSK